MKDKLSEFYEMLKLDRENSSWSRESTLESRQQTLLAEVHEIREALENNDLDNLKEELGDALWGVLYLMVLAEEKNMFTSKEVIDGAISKLKNRKPWVFTGEKITSEEELRRWKEIKKKEKEKNGTIPYPNTDRQP